MSTGTSGRKQNKYGWQKIGGKWFAPSASQQAQNKKGVPQRSSTPRNYSASANQSAAERLAKKRGGYAKGGTVKRAAPKGGTRKK